MTTRQTVLLGSGLGFIVCAIVLTFLWLFGIFEWRVTEGSSIDLTRVLWPSSVMLTVTWRCTVPGIMITLSSVAINCLLYMGTALSLRRIFIWFGKNKATSPGGPTKTS